MIDKINMSSFQTNLGTMIDKINMSSFLTNQSSVIERLEGTIYSYKKIWHAIFEKMKSRIVIAPLEKEKANQ